MCPDAAAIGSSMWPCTWQRLSTVALVMTSIWSARCPSLTDTEASQSWCPSVMPICAVFCSVTRPKSAATWWRCTHRASRSCSECAGHMGISPCATAPPPSPCATGQAMLLPRDWPPSLPMLFVAQNKQFFGFFLYNKKKYGLSHCVAADHE